MAVQIRRQYGRGPGRWASWPGGYRLGLTSAGRMILLAETVVIVDGGEDTGSGTETWVLVVSTSSSDTATGTDATSLSATLSGSDDGSGGDTEATSQELNLVGLDLGFSVDAEGDRSVEYYDTGAGTEGDEVIVYLVRLLSDGDSGLGTDLQNVGKVKRRNTALSHLGGWSEEGSITYPRPGV